MPVDITATRADLERTGNLFVQNEEDPGHLSPFWRKRIAELCDAIDSGIVPSAPTESNQAEVDALLASVRNVLLGDVEEKFSRAVWLVSEAVPRMRTLNNAASARWLPVAEEWLAQHVK